MHIILLVVFEQLLYFQHDSFGSPRRNYFFPFESLHGVAWQSIWGNFTSFLGGGGDNAISHICVEKKVSIQPHRGPTILKELCGSLQLALLLCAALQYLPFETSPVKNIENCALHQSAKTIFRNFLIEVVPTVILSLYVQGLIG